MEHIDDLHQIWRLHIGKEERNGPDNRASLIVEPWIGGTLFPQSYMDVISIEITKYKSITQHDVSNLSAIKKTNANG